MPLLKRSALSREKRNLFMGSRVVLPDGCRCAEMSDQDQLRNRATRLAHTPAVQARRKGHRDYAQRFAQRASEILEQPTALERFDIQCCQKRIKTPSRIQTAAAAMPVPHPARRPRALTEPQDRVSVAPKVAIGVVR